MKQTGIYIIRNTINDLCYVGQSVDILRRWYAHKVAATNVKNLSHYTLIHQAMYNLGVENFYYEVLEECDYSELNEREQYWIKYYDTYNNGYNMTLGGESNIGAANGRALLTEEDVVEIRSAYDQHIRFKDVYEKYKGKISKRGLQKVWHFETWLHIMPEVYTDENRKWHATQAKANEQGNVELGQTNKQRACSEEEIALMRQLYQNGLNYKQISEQMHRSASVVRKYCLFKECTNPDKTTGIQVRNVETSLVFNSYTAAAKWANSERHQISKAINTNKTAGTVPQTNEPAHWVKI